MILPHLYTCTRCPTHVAFYYLCTHITTHTFATPTAPLHTVAFTCLTFTYTRIALACLCLCPVTPTFCHVAFTFWFFCTVLVLCSLVGCMFCLPLPGSPFPLVCGLLCPACLPFALCCTLYICPFYPLCLLLDFTLPPLGLPLTFLPGYPTFALFTLAFTLYTTLYHTYGFLVRLPHALLHLPARTVLATHTPRYARFFTFLTLPCLPPLHFTCSSLPLLVCHCCDLVAFTHHAGLVTLYACGSFLQFLLPLPAFYGLPSYPSHFVPSSGSFHHYSYYMHLPVLCGHAHTRRCRLYRTTPCFTTCKPAACHRSLRTALPIRDTYFGLPHTYCPFTYRFTCPTCHATTAHAAHCLHTRTPRMLVLRSFLPLPYAFFRFFTMVLVTCLCVLFYRFFILCLTTFCLAVLYALVLLFCRFICFGSLIRLHTHCTCHAHTTPPRTPYLPPFYLILYPHHLVCLYLLPARLYITQRSCVPLPLPLHTHHAHTARAAAAALPRCVRCIWLRRTFYTLPLVLYLLFRRSLPPPAAARAMAWLEDDRTQHCWLLFLRGIVAPLPPFCRACCYAARVARA